MTPKLISTSQIRTTKGVGPIEAEIEAANESDALSYFKGRFQVRGVVIESTKNLFIIKQEG